MYPPITPLARRPFFLFLSVIRRKTLEIAETVRLRSLAASLDAPSRRDPLFKTFFVSAFLRPKTPASVSP
jgi:hypothetical protein